MAFAQSDLLNVHNYEWDIPCEFSLKILENRFLRSNLSAVYNGPWVGAGEDLSLFVDSIQIDAFTTEQIDKYYAGQWSFAVGRMNMRMLTINFRDYDRATIYSKLTYFQKMLENRYPEEQQWFIYVEKTSNMTRKDKGIVNNAINNILNNGIVQSASSVLGAIDNVFGTSVKSTLFSGLGKLGGALGTSDNYLLKTDKAVLVSVALSDALNQGSENQISIVSAQFVYTDNLDLPKEAYGVKLTNSIFNWGDTLGGLGSSVVSGVKSLFK